MQTQTTQPTANPWAQLLGKPGKTTLKRTLYPWAYLKPGKRLDVSKDRVRSASKALALYLKRNGIAGKAHEQHINRPCVWWEKTE